MTVNAKDQVKHAIEIMTENEYLSLPVLNQSEVVGMIDCLDIACLLADKQDIESTNETTIQDAINYSKKDPFMPLYKTGPFSALIHILSSDVHRCPIVDNKGAFIGVISQLDVITLLADTYGTHLEKNLGDMGRKTLSDLDMLDNVFYVYENQTVLECIQEIAKRKVSAVPIVNERNEVIGNFSISDIVRKVHKQEDLVTPIKTFLHTPLSWPVTSYPNTTFAKVIKQINAELLHRIWVVDDENNLPRGVISLSDVVRQLRVFYKDCLIE